MVSRVQNETQRDSAARDAARAGGRPFLPAQFGVGNPASRLTGAEMEILTRLGKGLGKRGGRRAGSRKDSVEQILGRLFGIFD